MAENKVMRPIVARSFKADGVRRLRLVPIALTFLNALQAQGAPDAELRNWFDTPFGQAFAGLPTCPRPLGPMITQGEMRTQAHGRIERGTSCWLAKKCEDSNVYKRDPEIQQRVLKALTADSRFAHSSVWLTTERRYITLQGCVGSASEQRALVEAVRKVDGVEQVFDQLMVGTRGTPSWRVDPAWKKP